MSRTLRLPLSTASSMTVTGKVTLDCPAGMITVAGTVADDGSELVSVTTVLTVGGGDAGCDCGVEGVSGGGDGAGAGVG